MRNKFIYICSSLSNDTNANIAKAINYCKVAIRSDSRIIPITPHIYYTQFLDCSTPAGQAASMDISIALLAICSEIWVYGYDHPCETMKMEIQYAKAHGIKIVKKSEPESIYGINRPKPVPSPERIKFWRDSYLMLNQTCPELFGDGKLLHKLTDLQQQEQEFDAKSDDERADYYACIEGLQSVIDDKKHK